MFTPSVALAVDNSGRGLLFFTSFMIDPCFKADSVALEAGMRMVVSVNERPVDNELVECATSSVELDSSPAAFISTPPSILSGFELIFPMMQ